MCPCLSFHNSTPFVSFPKSRKSAPQASFSLCLKSAPDLVAARSPPLPPSQNKSSSESRIPSKDAKLMLLPLLTAFVYGFSLSDAAYCRVEDCSQWFSRTKEYEFLTEGRSERYCQVPPSSSSPIPFSRSSTPTSSVSRTPSVSVMATFSSIRSSTS